MIEIFTFFEIITTNTLNGGQYRNASPNLRSWCTCTQIKKSLYLYDIYIYMKPICFIPFLLAGSLFLGCQSQNEICVEIRDHSKVKVTVIDSNIIRVSAIPYSEKNFPESSVALDPDPEIRETDATVEENDDSAIIRTASIQVQVSKKDGSVTFKDGDGRNILQEYAPGRQFSPIVVGDDHGYSVRQAFASPSDEAFYGLGQHQSNEWNYKDKNETLLQNNTKVSVPVIISSHGYGILWDNTSLTRWGDPRDYLNLDEVFDMDSLKVTWHMPQGEVITSKEKSLDHGDLEHLISLPDGMSEDDFRKSSLVWEGTLKARESGTYKFILRYGGYAKAYVDDSLAVAEHWRPSNNPNDVKFQKDINEGDSIKIRIEWRPEAVKSYIGLHALSPIDPQYKGKMSWWSEMADGIDYYFIKGTPDNVVSGYRKLTGKSPIVPKWALGFWQSRQRYKTQDEVAEVIRQYRDRHIPLDNIVLDWRYWKDECWGSHEFDSTRFPDPAAMIRNAHQENCHFMISVWPKFYPETKNYKELDKIGGLYKRSIEDSLTDWVGPGYHYAFYDALNPSARKVYWEQISKNLFSLGIDAWWLDASEAGIQANHCLEYKKALADPTYLGSSTRFLNIFPLENAQAVYTGQREEKPDQRVFILTRSAFAGLQRYGASIWSGDIGSRWEEMSAQITAGQNFSITGIPYWCTDIGGFSVPEYFRTAKEGSEEKEEWRELNTRWHQWAMFCPLYRSHGEFPFREIYMIAPESHPAYQSIATCIRDRYRLMPYFYSLAASVHFDDFTIMRPLVMDFSSDKEALAAGDEFMCGREFLVCPICKYGQRTRKVYLPAGCVWHEWKSGNIFMGGQAIEADAPYENIPVFIKGGSIIPSNIDSIEYAMQDTGGRMQLTVFGGADGEFTLYDDDGVSYDYEKGMYSSIRLSWDESERTLTIGDCQGGLDKYGNMEFHIKFIGKDGKVAEKEATYSGKELKCRF